MSSSAGEATLHESLVRPGVAVGWGVVGCPPGQPCQLQGGGLGVGPGGPRWWTGADPELRSAGPGLGAVCLDSTVDRCACSWLWAVAPVRPAPSHLSLLRPERDTDLGSAGPGLRTLGAGPAVPRGMTKGVTPGVASRCNLNLASPHLTCCQLPGAMVLPVSAFSGDWFPGDWSESGPPSTWKFLSFSGPRSCP